MEEQSLVVIAKIGKSVGLKGALWVHSFCQAPIVDYLPWRVGHTLDQITIYQKAQCTRHDTDKNRFLIALPDITSKEMASTLCHMLVWIELAQLSTLEAGEYYWHQLTGCAVVKQDSQHLFGHVDHFLRQGSADVMVVVSEAGKRTLVPFVQPQVIRKVDLVARVIEVEWDYY